MSSDSKFGYLLDIRIPTDLEVRMPWKSYEVMQKTIQAMKNILAESGVLTWKVFDTIYTQWKALDQLDLEKDIAMYTQFIDATRSILALPMDQSNPYEFIRMVTGIVELDASIADTDTSQLPSQVLAKFRSCLPSINQETINDAKDTWKEIIERRSKWIKSQRPEIFFGTNDYQFDLGYLKFFFNRANEDTKLNTWFDTFRNLSFKE